MGNIQSYGLKCYSKHALDLLHLAHNFIHYTAFQIIDPSKREDLDFHVMKMVDAIKQDDRRFPDGEISLESSYLKNDHFWTQTKVNHLVADAIQHTIHQLTHIPALQTRTIRSTNSLPASSPSWFPRPRTATICIRPIPVAAASQSPATSPTRTSRIRKG